MGAGLRDAAVRAQRRRLQPGPAGGVRGQVEGFAAAIEAGGGPGLAGQDGRAAVEMVEAAIRSSATGTAVSLPLTAA